MNVRFTLIIFLVFVAAALFLFTQRDREPTRVGPGAPTETPQPMLSLDPADIQDLSVVGDTGAYTLTRVAGGWEVDDQPASTEVDSIVTALAEPAVVRMLPEDRSPDDYGFASPTLTVTLRTASGEKHVLVVGDDTPADPQAFARLGDGGRIFVISKYDIDRLKEWLSAPPLAPTATPATSGTTTATPATTGTTTADAAVPTGTAQPEEDE